MQGWRAKSHGRSPDSECCPSECEWHVGDGNLRTPQSQRERANCNHEAPAEGRKLLELLRKQSRQEVAQSPRTPDNNDLLRSTARFIASRNRSKDLIRIEDVDLRPLWRVPLQPPVTATSLSVLDCDRLASYAKLCHDCHFQRDIRLRPNSNFLADEYWAVLAVEFSLYIQHNDVSTTHSWLERLTQDALPLRLCGTLEAIKQILKKLVAEDELDEINCRIDPPSLARQIASGHCDLTTFSKSLRAILKRSCCEARVTSIDSFVLQMQHAVHQTDPCIFADAVCRLFQILEDLKLDISHSYIRQHRHSLIQGATSCEQRYFQKRINADHDASNTCLWYSQNICSQPNPQLQLALILVDDIEKATSALPWTFAFDQERLGSMRAEFNFFCAQLAVTKTAERLLTRSSSNAKGISGHAKKLLVEKLVDRVREVDSTLSLGISSSSPSESASMRATVALEIVRTIDAHDNRSSLPASGTILYAEKLLSHYVASPQPEAPLLDSEPCGPEPTDSIHSSPLTTPMDVRAEIRIGLRALVQDEVVRMYNLPATELYAQVVLGYARSFPPSTPISLRLQTGYAGKIVPAHRAGPSAVDEVRHLARQIAHLAIIHWRIWQPILSS